MLELALAFALKFAEYKFIPKERIEATAAAAVRQGEKATNTYLRLPLEKVIQLEMTWSYFESRWNPKAEGKNKDCGVVQVNQWSSGVSCEELKNPDTCFSVWLGMFSTYLEKCGTVSKALGAMSTTGVCGGAPMLVKYRCSFIPGGCD